MRRIGLLAAIILAAPAVDVRAETITVCPAKGPDAGCRFKGDGAIQAAVDAAADGDLIRIRRGRYSPAAYRDVPFQDVTVRGYVVILDKRLTIAGDEGAVIDGGTGRPSSAFVLRGAEVTFQNLLMRGFRHADPEDNIYDGHGIFAINSRVSIRSVTMEHMIKMSLTGRGDTLIDAVDLRLLSPHVGIWLEESAHAHIRNSVFSGGDSAAVAAYMNASANIYNSVIEGNRDDGLYAKGAASIFATNSILTGNTPYAINAEDKGRILVVHSLVHGNAAKANPEVPPEQLRYGPGIIEADPRLDRGWKPKMGSPLLGKTDPDIGRSIGLEEKQ